MTHLLLRGIPVRRLAFAVPVLFGLIVFSSFAVAQAPANIAVQSLSLTDEIFTEARAKLDSNGVRLPQADIAALRKTIAAATDRVFRDSSGRPTDAALKRLRDEVDKLTDSAIALDDWERRISQAELLELSLIEPGRPRLGAAVGAAIGAAIGGAVGAGGAVGTTGSVAPRPLVECFTNANWLTFLVEVQAAAAPLQENQRTALNKWVATARTKVTRVTDTDTLCLSAKYVDELRTILRRVSRPTREFLEQLVSESVRKSSSTPVVGGSGTGTLATIGGAAPQAAVGGGAPQAAIRSTATQAAPSAAPSDNPGLIERTLGIICPVYPIC